MNNNNIFIFEKELVLSLVLICGLCSLVITFSLGSSRIMEGWRLIFSHAHEMEVSVDEIRNLLVIATQYMLIILAPIFVLAFFRSRKMDNNYPSVSKIKMPLLSTLITFMVTFIYIFFKLDHIISVMSLTVDQIFTFIWKISMEIFAIILVVKILSILVFIAVLRFRSRPKFSV